MRLRRVGMVSGQSGPAQPVLVRALKAEDWPVVERIYTQGIATGNATFEAAAPTWEVWTQAHHPFGRLVAVVDGEVVGWVALSAVSGRAAYAGVAEDSVYVAPGQQRRGVGRALLLAMIAESEAHGIWTLQNSIFPENAASLALHERVGFRVVGRRERIGRLNGAWRDTLLMERRSELI